MTNKEYVLLHANEVIKDVPGFPKEGIIFKDIVPVFENPEYANKAVDAMIDEIKNEKIEFNKIMCPESRGFLFGVPVGMKTNAPVVLARKHGKLPRGDHFVTYDLEYGQAKLQVSKDSICSSDKVLIVDDLLATGGSADALARLVESYGAKVSGFVFYIELTPLKGREKLSNHKIISLVPVEAY